MPCCAFAAFLISQLVFALAGVKRFVFGSSDRRSNTAIASNAVVEWRLGVEPAAVATASAWAPVTWRPRRAWGWGLALAALVEVALLVGTVYSARAHFAQAETSAPNASQHSPLCGSH